MELACEQIKSRLCHVRGQFEGGDEDGAVADAADGH